MKTEIKIEKCSSPFCVIHTEEKSKFIEDIAQKISMMNTDGKQEIINGWDGDYCIPLTPSKIFRIFSQDKKVFVQTESEILLLKFRLYEVEALVERCGLTDFVRISNTDIVNFENVSKMDMSITGVIKVILKNNSTAFVSRRYMNKIRRQLCLKK